MNRKLLEAQLANVDRRIARHPRRLRLTKEQAARAVELVEREGRALNEERAEIVRRLNATT